MARMDHHAVRAAIREAARHTFRRLREEKSGERFYAFALCSDEEAQGACASANTEEGFLRKLDRSESSRPRTEAIIARHGMSWADYTNYYRWNLPEWAYHSSDEGELFRALDPLLPHPLPDEDDEPEALLDHRARLYSAMVLAMKDLDAEGFFGRDEERAAVVLLCDLVEPPEKYWFAVESARRLNPPQVFDGFLKQWMVWLSPSDRVIVDDPAAHSPVYRPLVACF